MIEASPFLTRRLKFIQENYKRKAVQKQTTLQMERDNFPSVCPVCGSATRKGSGSVWCSQPPCEWSLMTIPGIKKTLSSLSETTGGALAPPAKQGKKRSYKLEDNSVRKSLNIPSIKGLKSNSKVKYFLRNGQVQIKEMIRGKDKLGREYCTDNGTRVSCGGGSGGGEQQGGTEQKPDQQQGEQKPAEERGEHQEKPQKRTWKRATPKQEEALEEYREAWQKGVFNFLWRGAKGAYRGTRDWAGGLASGAKTAAQKYGQEKWDTLEPEDQEFVSKVYATYNAIEHKLETPYKLAQHMVTEVGVERGLSDKHIEMASTITSWGDLGLRWTVNIPILHHALEAGAHIGGPAGFLLAKVGYYMPVASIAYIGGSTILNPMATVRAARNLYKGEARSEAPGGHGHEEKEPHKSLRGYKRKSLEGINKDTVGRLMEYLEEVEDEDWFKALFAVAMDQTNDYDKAVDMAINTYENNPNGPKGDEDFSYNIIDSFDPDFDGILEVKEGGE